MKTKKKKVTPKKATKSNYYMDQLNLIDFKSDHDPQIKVTDSKGNETKWMSLNPEAIKAMLQWLSKELDESIKGLSGKGGKVKTIDIDALEWRDKVNGNSYFAGTVTVNKGMKDEQTFTMPFQYGYGSQYEQEAKDILMKKELIGFNDYGKNGKSPLSNHELKEQGIIIRSNLQKNCKKSELKSFSGIKKSIGSTKKVKVDWNFIEKYTSDYSSNKDVTNSNDLAKFIHGEMDKEDYENYIVSEFGKLTKKQAEKIMNEIDQELMKNAIEEYEKETGEKYALGSASKSDSLIVDIAKRGTITEKEMKLLLKRKNAGEKFDDAPIWDGEIELSKDQSQKGLKWLRNLWKSPTGKERSTNPFGSREEAIIDDSKATMYLKGFHDAGNSSHSFWVPLYEVAGDNTTMEYYVSGGKVNIVG